MYRITILSLLFVLLGFNANGQHKEVGFFGGVSYYNGDLNPTRQVINQVNPTIGAFYRKNINTRYALRFGANYGKLSAEDGSNNLDLSEFRDISFSTSILEAYGILEFNFIPYQINNKRYSNFSPYVFIGLSTFRVNPEVTENTPRGINPVGSTIAPAIPFGAGIKFNFIENLGLSLEWTFRKTYTDDIDGLPERYIDGYQLSNSRNNDWYSFLGITLNYKFLTESDVCPDVFN